MDYFAMVRQISSRATLITFALALSAAIFGRWPEAFGVLAGFFVSLINFRLLSISVLKQLNKSANAAARGTAIQCVFRYVFMVSVALAANACPNINVWAVFVGLVLIKAVILGEALVNFAKQNLKDFRHSAFERGDK